MASANISFASIPSSIRKPGRYAEFNTALAVRTLPGNLQRVLVLAQRLAAGSAELPVMRTRTSTGELECLAYGPAGAAVAAADADLRGEPFELTAPSPRALLLGDLTGLAALVFLADRLRAARARVKTFAILALDGVTFAYRGAAPGRHQPPRH